MQQSLTNNRIEQNRTEGNGKQNREIPTSRPMQSKAVYKKNNKIIQPAFEKNVLLKPRENAGYKC